MRYLLASIVSAFFLILFSCDNGGGELPDPTQKGKTFLQPDERFKKALTAELNKIFPDVSSGLNFGDSYPNCERESIMLIDDSPIELTSRSCFYDFDQEFDYEVFGITGYARINQEYRLYVYIRFDHLGIPPTGTYSSEIVCPDYSCYRNIGVGAYLINEQGRVAEDYSGDFEEMDVVNSNNIVTANFRANFYSSDNTDALAFSSSGSLSCCN